MNEGFARVVVRDFSSSFIATRRFRLNTPSVVAVEAMAILRGCDLGLSFDLNSLGER